jgi:hypothetical protein
MIKSAHLVPATCNHMETSASSPHRNILHDESATPLNVFRGIESGQSDLDSPRRDSTYQMAARKSHFDLQTVKTLAEKEQFPSLHDGSKDEHTKFELKTHAMTVGWQRAAFGYFEENTLEQKLWIQSTLAAAKRRGEDWIDAKFRDDKNSTSGCSSCLPDIVVVNDTRIQKGTDAFQSKAAAPWQRVWTPAEADMETKKSYRAASLSTSPFPANSMLCGTPSAPSDTYLYDEKRFVIFFLSCGCFPQKLKRIV